jgi:kynureninase
MKIGLEEARALDAADPLARFRDEFEFPPATPLYFAGHSLGLLPKRARLYVDEEMEVWSREAVEGHFAGERPWMPYHELVAPSLARIAGAREGEVVAMNSVTVNLHLLLVSFYRPKPLRHRILLEEGAFPSDRYALDSQARFHGYPSALVEVPRGADPRELIDDSIALVLLGSPNFLTGEAFDLRGIATHARERGCAVGFDVAHGAGNLALDLHDDGPDFAVWCSYKYLNAGPGAPGGAFVHERHAARNDLPRFAGWWGHDKGSRFEMPKGFVPTRGAEGWQLSNPGILQLATLRASLEIFDEAGISALRAKSEKLVKLLEDLLASACEVVTPRDPRRRGSMLTLRVPSAPALVKKLRVRGAMADARPPDILRAAAPPLYTRFEDVHRLASLVLEELG